MLYLGRRRNAYIVGLELAEFRGAAGRAVELCRARRVRLGAVWRVGDLVLWDNRCTMHRRDAFDPRHAASCTARRSRAKARPGADAIRRFSVSKTVLLIICLMYLILYVDRVNISTAAPLIKADLGLSNTQLGLAFSAFAYPYALFQLIGGYFGDKFGARLTLCVSGPDRVRGDRGNRRRRRACEPVRRATWHLGFGEGATFPTATRAMAAGCRSAAGVSRKGSRIRLRGSETR